MGGRGSGRMFRWDSKTSLEECRFVDVRDWKRRGLLGAWRFSWGWSRDGKETANIGVAMMEGSVTLSYRIRVNGSEWQDVKDPVRLVTTACHLGGERVWFVCPRCSGRAAKLYLATAYFRCQKCCRLPYASQQETALDRVSVSGRGSR